MKSLSRVQLLATAWTAAYQAPPSMGFSRQEYWSGVPLIFLVLLKSLGCDALTKEPVSNLVTINSLIPKAFTKSLLYDRR